MPTLTLQVLSQGPLSNAMIATDLPDFVVRESTCGRQESDREFTSATQSA